MNKTQLVTEVAAKAGLTKEQAANAVNAVFGTMSDALASGDKIQLVGFGTFSVKYRNEKVSKNPRTGESITVPASYKPAFSAGKSLKDAVAEYKPGK